MKKLFAFISAMLSLAAVSAQSNADGDVNYYGVDFSKTKVFGAVETGQEFKSAFGRINSLVIAEWPKYDPGKFLYRNIVVRDISATTSLNNEIDPSEVVASSSEYFISEDDIADMVRRYELRENEGTGLVIVGELLDKSTYTGNFIIVYFDIASREVLDGLGMAGKARGFGLRNYWAGALYEALRNVR
jgi:hypothetical protein